MLITTPGVYIERCRLKVENSTRSIFNHCAKKYKETDLGGVNIKKFRQSIVIVFVAILLAININLIKEVAAFVIDTERKKEEK